MYNIINLIIDIAALIFYVLLIFSILSSSDREWKTEDWIKLVLSIFIFYIAGDYKLLLVLLLLIYVLFFYEDSNNKKVETTNSNSNSKKENFNQKTTNTSQKNHKNIKYTTSTKTRKYQHNSHNTCTSTNHKTTYNCKPEDYYNNFNLYSPEKKGVKLLFKQNVIHWSGIYEIYYENGKIAYKVDGYRSLSFGDAKLKIINNFNKEIGKIEERTISQTPAFDVYENGRRLGSIRRTIGIFTPGAEIDFKDWNVECGYNNCEFTITDKKNKNLIAKISKKYLSGTDTYELNITDSHNSLYVVMFIIAMDLYNARYEQNTRW
ncbi:LURP-one-related family protein [Methanosphaera sp. ISO3-F5]|uniref:LURP-one-related/scramblase family protein n=1 Tax=Methanosphaera sp. ISO3-F5 TaxID=1452353 RepID=UPI002B2644C1|nr:LURP-one-related family protein [Methanosphaera sp. ISO3-F5]WQH63662.1 LURP-one-related family protein [Methanosphaera sp. ISO3-F5]